MHVSVNGDQKKVLELIEKGANVKTIENYNQFSILNLSCYNRKKDFEILKYLVLEKNLDVNQQRKPIYFRIFNNLTALLDYLIILKCDYLVEACFHLLMLGANPTLSTPYVKKNYYYFYF